MSRFNYENRVKSVFFEMINFIGNFNVFNNITRFFSKVF